MRRKRRTRMDLQSLPSRHYARNIRDGLCYNNSTASKNLDMVRAPITEFRGHHKGKAPPQVWTRQLGACTANHLAIDHNFQVQNLSMRTFNPATKYAAINWIELPKSRARVVKFDG